MITAELLFAKSKELLTTLHPVSTPEFPEGLFVRMMDAQQRSDFDADLQAQPKDDPGGFRAALVKHTAVNAEGVLIFADTPADELRTMATGISEPLFEKSMEVNRYSKRDQDQLEKKLAGEGSSLP